MPSHRADLVVVCDRIHSLEATCPNPTWFTVLKGRIQSLGHGAPPPARARLDVSVRREAGDSPLHTPSVVPGFVDAHAHFFQTGLDLLFVDLSDCTDLHQIASRFGEAAGRRSWVVAWGFEEEHLTDRSTLTRWDLDAIVPDRPVWVNRVDYHSGIANSLALRRLGVPAGTQGLVTDADGEPTGLLRSRAFFHAKREIARLYSRETKERAVRAATERCLENGITAVHALEGGQIFGNEGLPTLLRRLDAMPIDVTIFLQEKDVPFTHRLGFRHLGGCILVDGSIGSYTAALDAPYAGRAGYRGVLYERARELGRFVAQAHAEEVQLAFHAIGPRAIELVLDAYAQATRAHPRYDHRHRIEHFELATDDQIARARDLGVVVSMQPSFELYWGGPDGMYASRLGERWRQTNRLRTILDRGLRIAGGSDTNVTPPSPLLGIHAAVNHPNPEQRVSAAEALRMMTLDAATAAFNERRHGSLSPGKEASFVVLDADPLTVPDPSIRRIQVLETWSRGRRVYARNGDNGVRTAAEPRRTPPD